MVRVKVKAVPHGQLWDETGERDERGWHRVYILDPDQVELARLEHEYEGAWWMMRFRLPVLNKGERIRFGTWCVEKGETHLFPIEVNGEKVKCVSGE